jgi:hypothetical protein
MNLSKPVLLVDCDDDDRIWSLSFEDRLAGERCLQLTLRARGAKSPNAATVVAKIDSAAQIEALADRIRDYEADYGAEALATEIVDLLLTLSPLAPSPDCVAFLVWRLSVWISENRRAAWGESHAA